jgi:hypothetical protein
MLLLLWFSDSLSIRDHFINRPCIIYNQFIFATFQAWTHNFVALFSFVLASYLPEFLCRDIRRGTLDGLQCSLIYVIVVAWSQLFKLARLLQIVVVWSIVWGLILWRQLGWMLRELLLRNITTCRPLNLAGRWFLLFTNLNFGRHQSSLSVGCNLIFLLQIYILIFKHHITVLIVFFLNNELSVRLRIFIEYLVILKLHFSTLGPCGFSIILLTVALQYAVSLGWLWSYLLLLILLFPLPKDWLVSKTWLL